MDIEDVFIPDVTQPDEAESYTIVVNKVPHANVWLVQIINHNRTPLYTICATCMEQWATHLTKLLINSAQDDEGWYKLPSKNQRN